MRLCLDSAIALYESQTGSAGASRHGPHEAEASPEFSSRLAAACGGFALDFFEKGGSKMSTRTTIHEEGKPPVMAAGKRLNRGRKSAYTPYPTRFSAHMTEIDAPSRHAELFYMQKQIQSQTQMVIVLEDGEKLEGCIEWYDRNVLKVRGRGKTMIYKSAIKYMYKLGDSGQQPIKP
jgi:sRNA-binding regulator protein Hfq